MNKIFLSNLIFGAFLQLFAVTKVNGKVDSVTVFTDRAVVKRVQAVESAEKTGTLRFMALPQSLMTDSVRASGTGSPSPGSRCATLKRSMATNGQSIRSRKKW
jgi:hypothetical protein